MGKIERIGVLLGLVAGASIGLLFYQHFGKWTAAAFALVPAIHMMLAGREALSSAPSSRVGALLRLNAALAAVAVLWLGHTQAWPAWKLACGAIATFFVYALTPLGGRIDRAVGKYRTALSVSPHLEGAARLRLRGLEQSVAELERAKSRELLAEARSALASETYSQGHADAARRLWTRAASEFAAAGRPRTSRRLVGSVVRPSGPVALPWGEILSFGYVLWSALFGAGLSAALWYLNRGWLQAQPDLWIGFGVAVTLLVLGAPIAAFGLMGGDARGTAVPRLVALTACCVGLCVGWTSQRVESRALLAKPPAAKSRLDVLVARPVQAALSSAAYVQQQVPDANRRWTAIGVLGVMTLAAGFLNPLPPVPGDVPSDKSERTPATRSRKTRRSTAAAHAIMEKIEAGADDEALELARATLATERDDNVLYLAGYLELKKGHLDEAIRKLEVLAEGAAPHDTVHHLAVGLLTRAHRRLESGRHAEALEDFRAASALGVLTVEVPTSLQDVELTDALGLLCRLQYERALKAFESVRNTTTDEITKLLAQTGVVITRFHLPRTPTATEIVPVAESASKVWESTASGPDEQMAAIFGEAFRRAFLRSQGPVDGRLPRDLYILAAMAVASARGQANEIKKHAEAALRLDPKSPEAHLIVGLVLYYDAEDREGALKHLTIAQQQGEIRELVPMLQELREEVVRLKEANKSYFDFLDAYLSDPEVPAKIRWALVNDPRIREALRRYAGRSDTFANMVERAPSLSDYAKRVEMLHKERLPRIQEKLGEKERAEVNQLLTNMKGYHDQLVTLLNDLQSAEREVLIKTGRFVSGSNGGTNV